MKAIRVWLPSSVEITEIVRRVETLFAFADSLTPSLIVRAFRGKLVPQDPNDEPTAELLRRLQASTPTKPTAKRGRLAAAS